MVHHGQRLSLRLEAGDDRLRVHAQLDDLQRNLAAHGLLLLSHINHAHAAFADLLHEFVTADDSARALVRPGVGRNGLGRPHRLARFQEIKFSRLVERREQFVNASAQVPILAAGPEEIPFAGFARGNRQRLLENFLFLFHRLVGRLGSQ